MPESQPDDEVIKFATKLFGLAREGDAEQLVASGADTEAGQPSAVATALMFERADLLELLRS